MVWLEGFLGNANSLESLFQLANLENDWGTSGKLAMNFSKFCFLLLPSWSFRVPLGPSGSFRAFRVLQVLSSTLGIMNLFWVFRFRNFNSRTNWYLNGQHQWNHRIAFSLRPINTVRRCSRLDQGTIQGRRLQGTRINFAKPLPKWN